jgi:hypothetical protein
MTKIKYIFGQLIIAPVWIRVYGLPEYFINPGRNLTAVVER